MKVEIIENHSGAACGKQFMKFTDDKGNLMGCIQPVNIEFYALGGTMEFITYNYKTCKTKIFGTPMESVMEILGVKELDDIDRTFDEIFNQISANNFYKES